MLKNHIIGRKRDDDDDDILMFTREDTYFRYVATDGGKPTLQINAQNCLHCKVGLVTQFSSLCFLLISSL